MVSIETLPGGMRKVSGGTISADHLDAAVRRANSDQRTVDSNEESRLRAKGDHYEADHVGEGAIQRRQRERSEEKANVKIVKDGGLVARSKGQSDDPHAVPIEEAPQVDNPDEPADQQTVKGKPATEQAKDTKDSK